MKPGFYWVRFNGHDETWTVGKHDGSDYLPWQVIGSDEIFSTNELEIGPRIEPQEWDWV